ncbi:MAG: helix-turn-helix transcriptional regulator [Pyrinomonadaceae bacterium]|nr:helix-turn-helix transcriptional regulator [Sphingobacteriaceae bacterium]
MEKYFNKKIKTVRLKLGYSQFDFAKLLQMSQIELYKIETGQITPRIEILSKFAEVAFYDIISPYKKRVLTEENEKQESKFTLSIVPNHEE